MKVTVTSKHLDEADEDTAAYNSVCLAISEAAGQEVRGSYGHPDGSRSVFFSMQGPSYLLPKEAVEFEEACGDWYEGDRDVSKEVPFTFELAYP